MTRREFATAALLLPRAGRAADGPWKVARTERLGGLTVTLSEPVLVARSRGYLWFPTLARTADGGLLAVMNDYADVAVAEATCLTSWSGDGGRTWAEPKAAGYGDLKVATADGGVLLLPYYMRPDKDGVRGVARTLSKGGRELRPLTDPVTVSGWPRPLGSLDPKLGLAGFVFNGQAVPLKDGGHLATLYGRFEGDKHFTLVTAESRDALRWRVRSVVASVVKGLRGSGASESALCRLPDGRLMCVYRTDGLLPYAQTWSGDDGRTWTEPVSMGDVRSVQPCLAVLAGGTVVLSGGRPGIHVWFNRDGSGKGWQGVDVAAAHNAARPDEPIVHTSSYTEVVPLDGETLLLIYDRLARGWHAIPKDSAETNSVWVTTLRVKRVAP